MLVTGEGCRGTISFFSPINLRMAPPFYPGPNCCLSFPGTANCSVTFVAKTSETSDRDGVAVANAIKCKMFIL